MKFLDVPPRYRSHTESKCSWKKSGFIRLTALKADFDDILAGFRGILLSVTNLDFTRICQDWIGLAKFTRTYPDICLTQIFVFFQGPQIRRIPRRFVILYFKISKTDIILIVPFTTKNDRKANFYDDVIIYDVIN